MAVSIGPPLPPHMLEKKSTATPKKKKKKKNKTKTKKLANESQGYVSFPTAPSVSHYESAPMPSELTALLPPSLTTREQFHALVSTSGLTSKKLGQVEALLKPNDPANNQHGNQEAVLDMVNECLGAGLNGCCGATGNLRLVRLLLANGANPSYMGQQFEASPVHRAIRYGHDNVVQLLLQNKVSVNATDPNLGRTPLHFTAQYNQPAMAKLLVQKGASVDAVDNQGETAADIARRLKWKKVAAVLNDPSVLFWNYANRATKMYKVMEYELAINMYEKAFAMLDEVNPTPSATNRATLYYNCARASANLGRHISSLERCEKALKLKPDYTSAREQRAKSNLCIYNWKHAVDGKRLGWSR